MPIIRSLKLLRPEPAPEPVPVEEKLAIEEMVPDIPAKIVPEDAVAETAEKPIEETAQPEPEEKKAEETAAKEEPPKKTRKKSAKAKAEEEPEEIVHVNNNLKQDLRDAVASVTVEYVDPAFEEFKERLEKDLLRTVFDDQADSGIVRMVLSNLCRCFDNVTQEYARVNSNLEQLANKSYGLIPRQIAMNAAIGANEVIRKRNGIHAPEVYQPEGGGTINLYALQAGLEQEAAYLQMRMKQLEYRRSTLISYLTANKLEAGIGD